ncbi:MAG: 6-hydroxymethylpterin diphosphokinase MptE-like protein [Myxococcota bacterium]
MELAVEVTPSGLPSLRFRGEWLDDSKDPVAAALAFADPEIVEGANRVVLFGAGLGYRILRLEELGVDPIIVFEPNREVVSLCRQYVPRAHQRARVFTEVTPFLDYLIDDYQPDHSTRLLAAPAYRRAYPEFFAKVEHTLRDAQGFVSIKKKSLEQRSQAMVEAAMINLGRAAEVPDALSLGRPLEGSAAFIVAAGPSLDKNGSLLFEASKKGAIFAVNTSAPVVKHYGAEIDCLVSIEAMRAADQMHGTEPRCIALDFTAHPASFEVPSETKIAFAQDHPAFAPLATKLGLRRMRYGASVATAAVSLAWHLGADPIVVVGQDLAFTGGRVYATGTGREAATATVNGEILTVEYGLDGFFEAHGVKPPSKHQPRQTVAAWGGGMVESAFDLSLFRRWFEGLAHFSKDVRFINATEGGARIEGWEEHTLRAVIDTLSPRSDELIAAAKRAKTMSAEAVESLRQETRSTAKLVERAARKCLKAQSRRQESAAMKVRKLADNAPFVRAHAAGPLSELRSDESLAHRQRYLRTFEIIRDSARTIRELAE